MPFDTDNNGEPQGGPADGAERGSEFVWHGHEEGAVYAAAALSYIALGVLLQSVVLNWIVGPSYFVVVVWAASVVLARRKVHRS